MLHAYPKISWPQPTDSLPTNLSLGDKYSFPWVLKHFISHSLLVLFRPRFLICTFPSALSLSRMSLKQGRKTEQGSKIEEGSKTEQDCGCSLAAISASCASLDWHNSGLGADGFFFRFASFLPCLLACFGTEESSEAEEYSVRSYEIPLHFPLVWPISVTWYYLIN